MEKWKNTEKNIFKFYRRKRHQSVALHKGDAYIYAKLHKRKTRNIRVRKTMNKGNAKNIWWSSMHVSLKLNSQVYINLTRHHWNRIIVELSAKYNDLLYLKCICHTGDKRYAPWKIVWFLFVCLFVCFFSLLCLYDCMLVSVALEHVSLISERHHWSQRCLRSTAKYHFSYTSLPLEKQSFDFEPDAEREEVTVPQLRCNAARIRTHNLTHTSETFYITLSPSLLT